MVKGDQPLCHTCANAHLRKNDAGQRTPHCRAFHDHEISPKAPVVWCSEWSSKKVKRDGRK